MLKVTFNANNKQRTVCACDIKTGTLFSGSISTYDAHVFIKGYDTVIALDGTNGDGRNGGRQWSNGVTIRNYIEVDGELIVTEKE